MCGDMPCKPCEMKLKMKLKLKRRMKKKSPGMVRLEILRLGREKMMANRLKKK